MEYDNKIVVGRSIPVLMRGRKVSIKMIGNATPLDDLVPW